MQKKVEVNTEELFEAIYEYKKKLRKYGGSKKLYEFLQDDKYNETIFIKNKSEASFPAYLAQIKKGGYKDHPLLEQSTKQDFVVLLQGIKDFLEMNGSKVAGESDKETDYVYMVGYYPDVKLSENRLAKFKKMVLALHKDKDKVKLYFFDSKEDTIDEAMGTYTIEDQTTAITIFHKNQKTSQIRIFNPSMNINRYLGGFALIMYSSRYNEQISMKAIFEKRSSQTTAFAELENEEAFRVPPQVVPALIEHVLQFSGERNSEFEGLHNMKDYLKYSHLNSIKGLYIGYHLSQTERSLKTLIAIILANGKTILLTENHEEPYSGYFTFIDDLNIIGRFHYTGDNPSRNYFRFQFNCREEDINKNCLMGTYSGRSANSNEPMAGRILFQKIDILDDQIKKYTEFPDEKEKTELEILNLLKKEYNIKTYLLDIEDGYKIDKSKGICKIEDLKEENKEHFEVVINFFLGESDEYVESFKFLEKYLYPLRPKDKNEFKNLDGLYYLYSFEKQGYIQHFTCNPLEISEQGNVRMKRMGNNQFYIGSAIKKNDRLSITFTYLDKEEIFPIHFMCYIGGAYPNDDFIPTLSLSAITRPNPKASRDFLVKINKGIEIKLDDLETYHFSFSEINNIDEEIENKLFKYINKDTHTKIINFIHSEFNNLIRSTKNNRGTLDRKLKPWEIFFSTAAFYAIKGDKIQAIEFLNLAEQHRFSFYYKDKLETTVELFNHEKSNEAFDKLGINFKGYLNIE